MSEPRQNAAAASSGAANRRSRALALMTLGTIALTGGPRRAAGTIILGPGKPLALLTYLHCAPKRAASRDSLIDLLWSDDPAESGHHNLRQTVWYIRQRLGDDAVAVQHGIVRLLADIVCDRDAFMAAVDDGDHERAVALYAGDFLTRGAGEGASGFEDWASLERHRLRRSFRAAAGVVVRERSLAGRFDDAQRLARRVRDSNADEEGNWRLLLEALLVAGDQRLAASEADTLEWHLAVRGREPEPATRAVLRRVRHQAATLLPGPSAAGSGVSRLIGRDEQLSIVLRGWDRASRGNGLHIDVIAAAGFGKTRLLMEAHARLGALGAPTLYLAASPATRDVPHVFTSEIAGALARLPGSACVSPSTAASLVALNPALASRFSAHADAAVGEEAMRRRVLAIVELCQAISDEQPFVLLLDDVHWTDAASRQMLEGLLDRVGRFRALIVTAARPAAIPRAITPASTVLHLPPLGLADVRGLLTDLGALPNAQWAHRLPEQLRATTAGSPLVLLDVLGGAMETRVLTIDQGTWRCSDPLTIAAQLDALRATRVQPIESHPRSLLVLPLAPLPGGDADRWSDGFTEDLIAALSRIAALRVISWPSARRLKGVDRDVVTLAAEVSARFVLQGSVRAAEADLEITAEVTDATTGVTVWRERCRGKAAGLSGMAQRFARAIAEGLLVTLTPAEDRRIRRRAITNGFAYECYLRARETISQGLTVERLPRTVSLLRAGLRIGGENALLYSTLGTVYAQYGMLILENERTLRRGEVCARKALKLDPESAEAHFLTGLVRCRRGNTKEGVRDMLRALAIDPHYTDALYWCSGWLGSLGRIETARPLAQRLLETDPLTSTNLCIPGWIEWLGGRFEAALPWYARWREREPGHPMALYTSAMALIWNQHFDAALELLERLNLVAPSTPLALYKPFLSSVFQGDQAAALAAVTPQLAAAALCSEFTCWQMAAFHAMIGANEPAVEWLENATRRGFINYPMLAEHDPFLQRLRGEPRFTRLLDTVKREWESLEF